MKLIIVDLYGDGSIIRIIKDTPANWKLAKAWDKIEDRECDFCDYMEAKGVQVYCTRRLGSMVGKGSKGIIRASKVTQILALFSRVSIQVRVSCPRQCDS